jgi:hypothetical protein
MMKKLMMVFAAALSLNAFAEAPKEPVQLAGSYDPKAPSISVQGLGNKILDVATSAKYFVTIFNGAEYAYSFKRLGSNDVKYIGKQSDIQGLVFIDVTGYVAGRQLNAQISTYRQSKYSDAIFIKKFDRDEKKPYEFDLGLDTENRLFIINKPGDVIYLKPASEIQKPVSAKERFKDQVF